MNQGEKRMYLIRKADQFLENWKKNTNRLPLIIKGARQVGKTQTIRHFGESQYKNFIEINFAENPEYKTIISGSYSPQAIIQRITLIDPSKKFDPGNTLIFFDEFQECPDIATSLKFFKQDGRYDVICSGSLLGTHYQKINSISVGYKTDFEMFSMDFEEFLWANGYGSDFINEILRYMLDLIPFDDLQKRILSELFYNYCVLGGMPAVIRSYVEKQSFEGTLEMQWQIIQDYEEDVRKYVQGLEQTKILSVFRSVPAQLAKGNKKFQYNKVDKKARAREYQGCIDWLSDAGVINRCYNLNYPELPLKGNYDPNAFKIYFCDTGLLVASLDDEASADLRNNRNLGTYKGALYENIAAELLRKQGFALYYYRRGDSQLEEDFFIRTADALVPVEVKATTGRSKSLSTLIKSDHYPDILFGIKLSIANMGFENQIYSFPFFCGFLLKKWRDAFFS